MNNKTITLNETIKMHREGNLLSQPRDVLERCSSGLLDDLVSKRHDDLTVPAISEVLNQALLLRLLEEQEKRNKFITKWFLILAVVTLISSLIQIGISLCK